VRQPRDAIEGKPQQFPGAAYVVSNDHDLVKLALFA
jgi:hypothetical protein